MIKKIILLGASGSIGVQSLEVIRNYPNLFSLEAISVGYNTSIIDDVISEFNVKAIYMIDDKQSSEFMLKHPNVSFYCSDNLTDLIDAVDADIVINAIVGIAGLKPTIKAIENRMDIALANKETLVAGGDLIMNHAKDHNVNIYPVDSEHSAIWQSIIGNDTKDINSITLTASGGSFRHLEHDQLKDVTKADALNHPNWSMGEKITIDSATMMNKGLEIIEAHYLFDIDYDNINVILHHQSIVHSYVEFNDYSIIAQLGNANMNIPIQFALTYPNHLKIKDNERLNLSDVASLTFSEVSFERFPLVKLAYDVGRLKGNKPIVMNAANEVAVRLFLDEKISFLDIETLVINTTHKYEFQDVKSFESIFMINSTVVEDVKNNYKEIILSEAL